MSFVIKKFIAQFLLPVPFVFLLIFIGFGLMCFKKYKIGGRLFIGVAVFIWLASAYGIGHSYLYRLERCFPPLIPDAEMVQNLKGCDVVVLGQGIHRFPGLPPRHWLGGVQRERLAEGAWLYRSIPEARLILSVPGVLAEPDKLSVLSEWAKLYNIPVDRISVFGNARDTSEEADNVRRILNGDVDKKKIILVTSASHLPRAMFVFHRKGMECIPAPCEYSTRDDFFWVWGGFCVPLPSVEGVGVTTRFVYEFLGNLYERYL